jgi:hypothetical protein
MWNNWSAVDVPYGRIFENRSKKQGSRTALNGFLLKKRVSVAEQRQGQQEGGF